MCLPALQVTFAVPGLATVVELAVLVLLLGVSAFISGSESAFFSLRPADLDRIEAGQDYAPYRAAQRMLGQQDRLLATILFMNNFVNVGIVILSVFITNAVVSFEQAPAMGFLVKGVLITFILLLFGEILPKLSGASNPLRYVRFAARPLYGIYCAMRPIASVMALSMSRVHQRFSPRNDLSIDDLGEALAITGSQQPEEESMLRRIVQFGHIEVREIMRPRIDVVAIEQSESYDELRRLVLQSGYSRIPVYKESFDEIVGILYVKDLIPYIDEQAEFNWGKLVRKAYFVPENKKIDDLFTEFQRARIHFAVVVDEYGGTCGIITLEDILEEIFGEIGDESDGHKQYYTRLGEGVYMFEAKVQLNDFCKILQLDDAYLDDVRGASETLAGLVLEKLERFPEKGEVITVNGLTLTVEAVTNRRIERLKVEVDTHA